MAGAPVPKIFEVTPDRLTMERVSGSPNWPQLGRCLATVHRTTNDVFGWHRDNVIGDRPQRNPPTVRWPEFFIENRLRTWIPSLPRAVGTRLERACEVVLPRLLDHGAVPSLVHGDLWAGNVVDGAYLIDPAVSYSDREVELAFATLFGGIPESFFASYRETWPLDDGWEERRPALQLYHALVHVAIFGEGYVPMVVERLDTLGV